MRSRLETLYVGVALTYFVVGVALGIGMGITQDFSYMHLHAHINLVGFVAHGVFGITHRLWPALRETLLAPFQFSLMLIGTPIFLVGLPLAQYHSQPIFAIIGSLMVLAAAAVFLAMFAGRTWRAVQV